MTTPPVMTVSAATPVDRASYPVDFALLNDDGLAVLAITDDPTEHHAHLVLTNTSGADILLDPPDPGKPVSSDLFHFELRFRPGMLSAVSVARMRLADQDDWSATAPAVQPDGTVSVYLLYTGSPTLNPGTPVRLLLTQITADGTGGARGTQLELRTRGLRYPDGTPLSDTRLIHLDLVNQRGKKNIPLHVGFVGSHTVLNDGRTPNTLTVRITNASSSNLTLNGETSSAPSTFILSFDSGTSWGLATPDALAACTLDAIDDVDPERTDWTVAPGRQLGADLAWTLTHRKDGAALAPGQVIQVRLGNIVSALPSGDTNLYLRYENIPGYWDGQFVCTIEKGPVHYDDGGNVGIGTTTPARALQVGDDAGGLGLEPAADGGYLRFGDRTGRRLRVARSRESTGGAINTGTAGTLLSVRDTGEVGVGTDEPNARLTVQADSTVTPEGRQIVVRGDTDARDELAVGYHTTRNYGSLQAVSQGTAVRPLMLNPAGGGVAIGLERAPTAALEVNGGIRSSMWQVLEVLTGESGPLPVTSDGFSTAGGTLVLFVSGSGYRRNAGSIGLQVRIDGEKVGEFALPIGAGNQRFPLNATMVKTDLAAGAHLLSVHTFSDAPDMLTDASDQFRVTLLELPF
jgi:hypothetical protein